MNNMLFSDFKALQLKQEVNIAKNNSLFIDINRQLAMPNSHNTNFEPHAHHHGGFLPHPYSHCRAS